MHAKERLAAFFIPRQPGIVVGPISPRTSFVVEAVRDKALPIAAILKLEHPSLVVDVLPEAYPSIWAIVERGGIDHLASV